MAAVVAPPGLVAHQRADRVARALDAPRFHQVRDRKQERHRGRLGPLPDRRRADRREADQHVHVEPRKPQRGDRARRHRPQAGERRKPVGDGRSGVMRVIEMLAVTAEQRLAP